MSIRDIVRRDRAALNSEAFRSAVRGPEGVEGSALNWIAPGQWGPGPDGATWAETPVLWMWREHWLWTDGRHIEWARERLAGK